MTAPDLAVAQTIDAVSSSPLSAYTLGTNLFAGPMRAVSSKIPHRAIFVLTYGGPSPLDKFSGTSIQRHAVQVMVRGAPDAFSVAQADAAACREALHLATISGYLRCAAIQPAYLGLDDTEHPLFSLNLELWREV
jgi:hypothetical protein